MPQTEKEASYNSDPLSQFLTDREDRRDHRILWLNGPAGAGKSAVA
jgi:adenylylsulfate kinase-like enzyme